MKGNKTMIVGVRMEEGMKHDLTKLAEIDNRKLSGFIRIQLMKIITASKKKV